MAEFIEVVRAKRRMCEAHTEECRECKLQLQGICSLLNVCAYSDDDVKKLENEVMAWAAEHPEPVYPIWWEWLENLGIVSRVNEHSKIFDTTKMYDPIPADIAEKLRIEPKENK